MSSRLSKGPKITVVLEVEFVQQILYTSNTAEEIRDAVVEKLDLMDGCFTTTKRIEDLQDHYRALTANKYAVYGKQWGATRARFSSKFLLAEQQRLLEK